ncbi:MAG: hypothetical protein GW861_14340 [Deltaproteobacteria bacterium]|nr:hypothetical protein [Deltaproteobacteria bacterium]
MAKFKVLSDPGFNSPEFEGIKNQAGLNSFILTAKQWIEKTNAIGIKATASRYGGTYAHSLSFRPEGEISCPECIATTYTY